MTSRARPALPARADVVIVGGGVMGSSIAYYLTGEVGFDGTVLVIERDPTYATASTTLSASSIRLQFSTPENVAMSAYGVEFLQTGAERFAALGIDAPLRIDPCPYLTLVDAAGAADLAAANEALRAQGVAVETLSHDDLAERYPWLLLDDIVLGALGPSEEGVFDATLMHDALRKAAAIQGVRFLTGEVVGMQREGDRITAIELADGAEIGCGTVVNAAGPHARAVAQMAGVDVPVSPRKHCVFVFDSPEPAPGCPIVVDGPGGVAFRPEGTGFLSALVAMPPERDVETTSLTVEGDLFDEHIWPALATRVPGFDQVRRTSAWAGLYEVNTHDHNAIIGAHPDVANLQLCVGFSGHGLQQAPAAGRAVAELIAHSGFRTLDLTALGFDRILAGRTQDEARVI